MANIQQGINQLLTTAAIGGGLFMHSDTGRAITASKRAEKQEQLVSRIEGTLAHPLSSINRSPEDRDRVIGELRKQRDIIEERAIESRKEAANLAPSNKREKAYIDAAVKREKRLEREDERELHEYERLKEEDERVREQMSGMAVTSQAANAHMRKEGTRQVKQKKDYTDFLSSIKNLPTSLGGKVKDLPIELQKKIAERYQEDEK